MSDFTCPYCGTPNEEPRCEKCHARPMAMYPCPKCESRRVWSDNRRIDDKIVNNGWYYENWKEELRCLDCEHRWLQKFHWSE